MRTHQFFLISYFKQKIQGHPIYKKNRFCRGSPNQPITAGIRKNNKWNSSECNLFPINNVQCTKARSIYLSMTRVVHVKFMRYLVELNSPKHSRSSKVTSTWCRVQRIHGKHPRVNYNLNLNTYIVLNLSGFVYIITGRRHCENYLAIVYVYAMHATDIGIILHCSGFYCLHTVARDAEWVPLMHGSMMNVSKCISGLCWEFSF